MNRVRGRAVTIVAGACLAAMLAVVPSAQAAVTSSSITTPKNNVYLLYNSNTPNTFAISGTTNGTTGDYVDVNCYAGDKITSVATNVAVNANGSFSVPAAPAQQANTYRLCQLHAVPHLTSPNPLTPYAGPRLLVGQTETYTVSGGANNGKLYDYYLYFQQLAGGMDYDSVGGCGIDDGYLLDNNSLSAVTWWCNAWLNKSDQQAAPTRSGIQVDGVNAYSPAEAYYVNSAAIAGFPKLSRSYSQNAKTGNSLIHETDPFVKCKTQTYPPTNVTCSSFASTGITDTRTLVQDNGGRVAWITDVFKNTTGKAHKVDLLWQNDQHFYGGNVGNASEVEYEFPGQSGYSTHLVGDLVNLPHRAGKILVRYHGAADGDPAHGRGAIVYDSPATMAKFMNLSTSQSDFTLRQVVTVPAHGTARLRFAYIADFQQSAVNALAKQAATIFKGCKVPNVVGKSLAAAKRAIKRAHCTVGRIRHAASGTIAAGVVMAEHPAAGTHVDYGTKVALIVSSG